MLYFLLGISLTINIFLIGAIRGAVLQCNELTQVVNDSNRLKVKVWDIAHQ